MRSFTAWIVSLFVLTETTSAINILLNNDDGFASANLRELYRYMKQQGHNVWIVAPSNQQSGQGGRSSFTSSRNLTRPSDYDIIPKGAPSVGPDPEDPHIWYYDGTPAACGFVGLDYVLPRFGDFEVPDLILTGPNFGNNLGPFLFTLSGTLGAAYTAVERSVPAIAFSGSNGGQSYKDLTDEENPASWTAKVAAKIAQQFINATEPGNRILPLGYGVSVNIPPLTSSYHDPPIVLTRITGGARVDAAVYNEEKGTFEYGSGPNVDGANQCINGDCNLPGESIVVGDDKVSVSVFTVDYDAPLGEKTTAVQEKVKVLTERFETSEARRRAAPYWRPEGGDTGFKGVPRRTWDRD
ncbi:acid phosphatase [Patellaria atrata CBS 101060]|uniref:Acid phosphatase n=1 Tax=Patellaria atrata CBS 101060 TaxID=1346257 RepID=A0A9P4SGI4_9PEZI|nr:acid phosphatase [Patellaria atrata CBS 101060]